MESLSQRLKQLQVEIQDMSDQRVAREKAEAGNPIMLQLRQIRQMSNIVANRKMEVLTRLERLQEKKAALKGIRGDTPGGIDDCADGISDDMWREKHESVKTSLPRCIGLLYFLTLMAWLKLFFLLLVTQENAKLRMQL